MVKRGLSAHMIIKPNYQPNQSRAEKEKNADPQERKTTTQMQKFLHKFMLQIAAALHQRPNLAPLATLMPLPILLPRQNLHQPHKDLYPISLRPISHMGKKKLTLMKSSVKPMLSLTVSFFFNPISA
jgi:hypothetical protein